MRALAVFLLLWPATVVAQASSSSNMTLMAHHDLGGRPAYQPVIHRHGDRWLAYVGHHASGDAGTSILDVSDVHAPKMVAHIPARGGAQMVRVCEGRLGVPVAEFAADAQGGTRDLVLIVNEQIASNCRETCGWQT